ncbi:hypothetical protein L323_18645 [Ruminiclostridium papyrosolvens C7]|uniref:Uncharacterized protein n=1 Tax=Ruminiclostridium papyrosolvens C7 TaxID=1330534 RepID=U4QX83_9FIRM|nr:hypothetical protein L323_18645 [Ruminiclostridium papyrosolvens C7]
MKNKNCYTPIDSVKVEMFLRDTEDIFMNKLLPEKLF